MFGAKESLTALAVALGPLATPLAIDLLGTRGALVALGLGCPLVAALAWRRLRSIDASIAYRDEEVEVLENVGMFRRCPMPAIDNLALNVMRAEVGAGEQVFRQGDGGDCFYVIEDGEAEVIGDRRLIRVLGPGEGFGEIALLRNTVRTTTVQARTPLRLYALNRRHFLAAVTGYHSSMAEADAWSSTGSVGLTQGAGRPADGARACRRALPTVAVRSQRLVRQQHRIEPPSAYASGGPMAPCVRYWR